MGRIVQRNYIMRHPESNVAFERTPLALLAATPHCLACMTGSNTFQSSLNASPLACHRRSPAAGVTLNSIRYTC